MRADGVREYLDRAAHCERQAQSARDRHVKAVFTDAVRCRRELATHLSRLQREDNPRQE
jgi:hypothetical protein